MTTQTFEGWETWWSDQSPLRLGISSCLLGEEVRYDGGHCRDKFVMETLGPKTDWVSVCPEMGIGLPTPRPTIRLVQGPEVDGERSVQLIEPKTNTDHTAAMNAFAEAKLARIRPHELDGYIVKKNSPSCGMERLPIYNGDQKASKDGTGVFTHYLRTNYPDMPIEEDGRLNDPRLREAFIAQIFCRNRWRQCKAKGLTRKSLVHFHTAHKMLLWSHNEALYRELGALVGSLGQRPDQEIFDEYGALFLRCLQKKATTRRHINVMQHAMGYLKTELASSDKAHLHGTIEEYRNGLIPLVVPLSLLRFNIQQHQVEYLMQQLYFDPFPKVWALQNYI